VVQGIHAFSVGFWLHFQQRGGRREVGQESDASGRIVPSRKLTFRINCLCDYLTFYSQIADGLVGSCGGVLRGQGKCVGSVL
jgi:hypothetical protein